MKTGRRYWLWSLAIAGIVGALFGVVGALGWESPLAGALLALFGVWLSLMASTALAALLWMTSWIRRQWNSHQTAG